MRRALAIAGACLVLLLLAWIGYRHLFRDEPPPVRAEPPPSPPPSPPPVPASTTFEIAEVAGSVEVRRGEGWTPVQTGERLGPADAIRTGPDGRAVLRSTTGDELKLRERVELEVGRLSEKTTELSLRRGKVRAEAAGSTERLQITSGEAQAVGKASGKFTVFADPAGAVTVASESGDTEVIAQGGRVTVGAGKQTFVAPGQKPGSPVPIPDEVFLQVAWPQGQIHAPKPPTVAVKGRAEPGSNVLVNGQPTTVRRDGRFEAQIPLRNGKNEVKVVAESMSGEQKEKKAQVNVDTQGPPLDADPQKMYDKKNGGSP